MNALVFDIEKFAVRDGPGIRSVVFLKGCPLRCLWCHNPESWSFQNELFFRPSKCVSCGNCVRECPRECHSFSNGEHRFDRTRCNGCAACAQHCYSGALKSVAKLRSSGDVLAEVLADREFFGTDGGLTVSGGEPMAQFAFTLELCRGAKEAGIGSALETCGAGREEDFRAIAPFVDLFLFDIKGRPEDYERLTGSPGGRIFRNLELLNSLNCPILLRCPLVPEMNDSPQNLEFIASLAEKLSSVKGIDVEPYHPLGISKWKTLGGTPTFSRESFVPDSTVKNYMDFLSARTSKPVGKG